MTYRVGTVKDLRQIKELVDATGYYSPIDPVAMGGQWAVAEHNGNIHGCVWFMIEPPNVFMDYWVGNGRTALRLLASLEIPFRKHKVTLIRAMIHESNTDAIQMAIQGLGAYGQTGYAMIVKELQYGNAENNDN